MSTELNLVQEWDKTFKKSEKVKHRKVAFHNRYGITLVADMYEPKNMKVNYLCYFSKDAYNNMIKDSKYTDNKELMIIPNAVHTDLYDNLDVIPFDKIEEFFKKYLK